MRQTGRRRHRVLTIALLGIVMIAGSGSITAEGLAQEAATAPDPRRGADFAALDWTATMGWNPDRTLLVCEPDRPAPLTAEDRAARVARRLDRPFDWLTGTDQTLNRVDARREKMLEDAGVIEQRCEAAAPKLEAGFKRAIQGLKGLGLTGPTNWGPVETRRFHKNAGTALAYGTVRESILIKPVASGLLATMGCGDSQDLAKARRAYITANVEMPDKYPPHILTYTATHELAHVLQNDRMMDAVFGTWANNPCGSLAKIDGQLRSQRRAMTYVPYDKGWATEGLADYLGFAVMRRTHGMPPLRPGAPAWRSSYGLKEYDKGLFGPHWNYGKVGGYRVSSFWRHLEDRYGLDPARIFRTLYAYPTEAKPPETQRDAAGRLALAIDALTGRSAARVLASFFTDFASWPEDRTRVHPAMSRSLWWAIAFDRCETVYLSPQNPHAEIAVERVVPYGARCLDVKIAPQAGAGGGGPSSYILSVEAGHDERHIADGLHLGRAVVQTGGLIGPTGKTTYACSTALNRHGGISGTRDCITNRAGLYVSTPLRPFPTVFRARWRLAPVAQQPAGHSDILVLTYAPVDSSGEITDTYRRMEEKKTPRTVVLRLGVDYVTVGKQDDDDGDDGKDGEDDGGPDAGDRTRATLARITPLSSQGSTASVGTVLFSDDPRADVTSELNHRLWWQAWNGREGDPDARTKTPDGYAEVMREVHAARWGMIDHLSGPLDRTAWDADRADLLAIRGFATDILEAPAEGGVAVGHARTQERFDWIFSEPPPEDRLFHSWDDLVAGARFAADINPNIPQLLLATGVGPAGRDQTGARRWGDGTVEIAARSDTHLHLVFNGRVCGPADTVVTRQPTPAVTCDRWRHLRVEGRVAFLETLRVPHIPSTWSGPIQAGYDAELMRSPRLGLEPASGSPRDNDPPPDDPHPPTPASAGGAGSSTCGCDRLRDLAAAIGPGGMPDDSEMETLDRCCGAFLACPDDPAVDESPVLSICRM